MSESGGEPLVDRKLLAEAYRNKARYAEIKSRRRNFTPLSLDEMGESPKRAAKKRKNHIHHL